MNNALPQRRKLISIECGTQEKVRNIAKITPSSSNLGLLENINISDVVICLNELCLWIFRNELAFSEICYLNYTEIITHIIMYLTLIQCTLVTEERFSASVRDFCQRKGLSPLRQILIGYWECEGLWKIWRQTSHFPTNQCLSLRLKI